MLKHALLTLGVGTKIKFLTDQGEPSGMNMTEDFSLKALKKTLNCFKIFCTS